MIIAIMQPYFFPYLGYFQLFCPVDHFVYLDDVTYIKGGWINRNYILQLDQKELFTVPLKNLSSNKRINQTEIHGNEWQKKLLKKIHQNYSKAPHYREVRPLLESVIYSNVTSIADLSIISIEKTLEYLGLAKKTRRSSELNLPDGLKGVHRVIAICKEYGADTYINSIGGMDLYQPNEFRENDVKLQFLQSELPVYPQFSADFKSGLSIIDVLMFNQPAEVVAMLGAYRLITPEAHC